VPESGDDLATSVAIRLQASVDSKLARRSGGVSRLGGVGGLRMTHSQRSSRKGYLRVRESAVERLTRQSGGADVPWGDLEAPADWVVRVGSG